MTSIKLMNMCMVIDEKLNKVLVLDKINSLDWNGITFPGGHVENGESIIESTIREVKEETGLEINNLEYSGLVNWYNDKTHERWFIFLYKTKIFKGNLIKETHEGKVFWIDYEKLDHIKLSNGMRDYLKLFLSDNINEAYAIWNDEMTGDFKFI